MQHRLQLILFIISCCFTVCDSQQNYFVITEVSIEGNKKTKEEIVLRELDILPGDTIYTSELSQRITENEKRILNTGLFTSATINIKDWDETTKEARAEIKLVENWYIYPAPIFELADRNFNVWWNEQNRSLDRINYGARVTHINLTGHRDKFKMTLQRGYTKKYELDYNYPYLDKAQTMGIRFNIFYSENTEIGYETIANKTIFYTDEENDRILLSRLRLNVRFQYRPSLYQHHNFNVEFHRNGIDDFIASDLNQDYFLNGLNRIRFFRLNYEFRFDKRIFFLYPEGGYQFGINLDKSGLGVFDEYNVFSGYVFGEIYHKPHERLILAQSIKAKTNFTRDKIAFANNTGLGYGADIIGGYELYVIDGTDYVLTKSSARFIAIDKLIDLGKAMPMAAFRPLTLKVFLTFNFDTGIVNEPTYLETNTLNNRWIYGYGPGLDIIMYNNWLFQIEYSFNQLGDKGVYIHNSISF